MAKLNFSITDKTAFEQYLAESLQEEKAFAEDDKRLIERVESPSMANADFRVKLALEIRLQNRTAGIEDLSFRLAFICALNPAAPNLPMADFKVDDKDGIEKSLTERFEAAKARFAESEEAIRDPRNTIILPALSGRMSNAKAAAVDAAFKYHQLKSVRP